MEQAICQNCTHVFEINIPESTRRPCPQCSFTTRAISADVTLDTKSALYLGLKHKRGAGKPIFESLHRPEPWRRAGKQVERLRIIDKENNHYKEVVTDPATGEIVHLCEEPLSLHTGHG